MSPHQGVHIWFPSSQTGSVMLIFDQKMSWGSSRHFFECISGLPVVIVNLHLGGFCPQPTRAFVLPFKDGGAAYVFVGIAISSCSRQPDWKAWDIPRTTQALCAAQTPPGTRNMTSTYHSSIPSVCGCMLMLVCVFVGWTLDIFPYSAEVSFVLVSTHLCQPSSHPFCGLSWLVWYLPLWTRGRRRTSN